MFPYWPNGKYPAEKPGFPFDYLTQLQETVTEDITPDVPPITPRDCSAYTVYLTDAQVLMFTSALQAGADLAYPSRWNEIMAWWTNARHNRDNPFWATGECALDLCDLIAECLRGDTAASDAVREIIRETQFDNGVGYQPEDAADTDDLNSLCGGLRETYQILLDAWLNVKVIVDTVSDLADATLDFITNAAGKIAIAKSALQGFETLFNAGSSLVDAWINQQSTEDAWVCAMYDRICGRGAPYRLREDDIDAAFAEISGGQPIPGAASVIQTATPYGAVMLAFARGSTTPEATCGGCDCTATWCADIDLTASDGGFVDAGLNAGVYVPGAGWRASLVNSRTNQLYIQKTFAQREVTTFEYWFSFTKDAGESRAQTAWDIYAFDGSTSRYRDRDLYSNVPVGQQNINVAATISNDVNRVRFSLRPSFHDPSDTGDALLTRVRLTGVGTIPPELASYAC
jgi:hypothetical protein